MKIKHHHRHQHHHHHQQQELGLEMDVGTYRIIDHMTNCDDIENSSSSLFSSLDSLSIPNVDHSPRNKPPKKCHKFAPGELKYILTPILLEFYKKSDTFPIRRPLDEELYCRYGINGHLGNSMSLSNIEKKLDGGEYTCPGQFVDDFRMIIQNARRCNDIEEKRMYYNIAMLRKIFNESIKPLVRILEKCCKRNWFL